MKEFFGTNITENRKNDKYDSEGYVSRRLSDEAQAKFDAYTDSAKVQHEKESLPAWLNYTKLAFGLLAGIFLISIIRGIASVSLEDSWKNASWVYILLLVFGAIFIGITIYGAIRKKLARSDFDEASFEQDLENVDKLVHEQFGIPEHAALVNVFQYKYKQKNGENKVPDELPANFITVNAKVFKTESGFALCMNDKRWDFSPASIHEIEIVNKRMCTANWLKEQDFRKEPFKQYKLTVDNMGRLWMPKWCRLNITLGYEDFILRFPIWELEVFEFMTGKKAARD